MASRFLAPISRGSALQRVPSLDSLMMVQRDMDRLFGNMVRSFSGNEGEGELFLVPRIDVRETGSAIEVDAELPGVSEQDVEVSIDDNALVITGETHREKREEKGGFRLAERQVGRFQRIIPLPFEPDPDKIDAKFRNGLLSVRIEQPPKTDRSRRITVKSGADEKGESASAEQKETTPEPAHA